jgi:hypothetical protein
MRRMKIVLALAAALGAATALAYPHVACAAGYCMPTSCFPGSCYGDCVCVTSGVGMGTCMGID